MPQDKLIDMLGASTLTDHTASVPESIRAAAVIIGIVAAIIVAAMFLILDDNALEKVLGAVVFGSLAFIGVYSFVFLLGMMFTGHDFERAVSDVDGVQVWEVAYDDTIISERTIAVKTDDGDDVAVEVDDVIATNGASEPMVIQYDGTDSVKVILPEDAARAWFPKGGYRQVTVSLEGDGNEQG